MPEAMPFELRIYCLCGQKMKVTSNMLGKPGKCIACRQKIRIPGENELGPDEVVIHLKDHPEYLRKPNRSPDMAALPDESASDLDRDDVLLEADSGQLAAVAFERYEPIRRLCNYEHKVKRQLQCVREGRPADLDKATLMSYRGLARQCRQQLESVIRDELIAIGAELQTNRESLGDRQLALRTGDTDHVSYSKAVLPQRQRREVLIYRQQNLRGWLATEDPHAAGGLEDIDLADVPVFAEQGSFPLAEEIDGLPIENAVTHLERALRARETADRLLNELQRMQLDGVIAVDELARRRADTEADRQRARTAIAFYRGRLEQVIQDCEDDSHALTAYEGAMREKLAEAAIAQDVYKRLEEAICRAQVDIKRARNMANRALNANAVSDVPNPHGTFLERLARPGSLRGLGADSWLAWAGSVLLLINLFVPLVSPASGAGGLVLDARALCLFVTAAIAALSGAVVLRLVRGGLLNLLWLGLSIGGALYIRNGELAETSGAQAAWWLTPGGMLALGAWALLGLSAVVSYFSLGLIRWVAILNLLLGVLASVLILSDFFGFYQPAPRMVEPITDLDAFTGTYAVQIPVGNDGRSTYWLGGMDQESHATVSYLLEYKVGANSWADAGPPTRVTVNGQDVAYPGESGLAVNAADQVVFYYRLPPGIFRTQLVPAWHGALPVRKTFTLDPPEPAAVRAADSEIEPVPTPAPPASEGIDVELRGVLDGQDSGPIFSIIIHEPGGEERKEQFQLGDKLHEEWVISEFSPAHTTITVVNGDRLLVIERGKVERLD